MAEIFPASSLVLDLATAVVAASNAPMLLLDGKFTVLVASASFARSFGLDASAMGGCALAAIGHGEWAVPQLQALLRATLNGYEQIDVYEMDLVRPAKQTRRIVLKVQNLDYGPGHAVRLLLAADDVTDARAAERLKDELVREKEVLLQELQHRVANSLQIVASVLMQSARRVQSEETRGHLNDAHQRVMSIAALQKQLSKSRAGKVALKTYLTELCQSIGASMIRDHGLLTLEVAVDDSIVGADMSVSIGLIVTELTINALKHAFPEGRHGKIIVDYKSHDGAWTLAVCDDGVGMPAHASDTKAGLGTSTVNALARQLRATIEVRDHKPGTMVKIVHAASTQQGDVSQVIPIVRAV